MILSILEPAEAELWQAARYYEDHQAGLGADFLNEYDQCLKRISRFPYVSRQISKECRRALFRRFPFAAVDHLESDAILIVAIMHLAREPQYWEERI